MNTSTQTVRIKNLGRIVTGTTPSTKRTEYYGKEYLFIKPSDIDPAIRRVSSTETMLSEVGHELQKNRILPRNTTCVVCIGTIGKICLTSEPCSTNQQINSVIPDKDRFDPIYVYYLLKTAIPKVQKVEGGSASGREHVNKTVFGQIKVDIHPLPLQRKIAAVLSAYDDLIENNTRRIAILEEMARRLYREWFVHFRFPGHEEVEMVEVEGYGWVPERWAAKKLGDVAAEIRRSVQPEAVAPTTPYFGLGHMPRKSIALSEWGTASEVGSTKLVFKKGEILFGKIRPYFHKVGVAPVDGVCSTDTIVIVPKLQEHYSLVLGCVSSHEFVAHATQTSKGTKMPRADWDVLQKYPVAIPSMLLLACFNELIEPIVDQIHNLIFRNRNLRETRDLLLPRLISGGLDVSGLDIAGAA